MGMDAALRTAHSKKEFELDSYWDHMGEIPREERWTHGYELVYWRKFYDLQKFIEVEICKNDYECGEYIEISREALKKIIEFCCYHRDYWDGFSTVGELCELYDHWDEIKNAGLKLFYECDW